MKVDLSKSAPLNCPSYDKCFCNACPLHEDYHKTLFNLPMDKSVWGWRKCRTSKSVRKKIGEAFKLINRGLTEKELAGLKIWESMSSEQQQAKKEEMKKNSPFSQLKSKGYAITRVKKDNLEFTYAKEDNPIAEEGSMNIQSKNEGVKE